MRCLFVLLLAAGCAGTGESAYEFSDPGRYGHTIQVDGKLPPGSFRGQR